MWGVLCAPCSSSLTEHFCFTVHKNSSSADSVLRAACIQQEQVITNKNSSSAEWSLPAACILVLRDFCRSSHSSFTEHFSVNDNKTSSPADRVLRAARITVKKNSSSESTRTPHLWNGARAACLLQMMQSGCSLLHLLDCAMPFFLSSALSN